MIFFKNYFRSYLLLMTKLFVVKFFSCYVAGGELFYFCMLVERNFLFKRSSKFCHNSLPFQMDLLTARILSAVQTKVAHQHNLA